VTITNRLKVEVFCNVWERKKNLSEEISRIRSLEEESLLSTEERNDKENATTELEKIMFREEIIWRQKSWVI
jgi:predicted lipase